MKRTLTIDRFEGSFAICEGEGQGKELRFYAIETAELPKGAREGDVLEISEGGELSLNPQATEARRKRVRGMQDSLWE